MNKNIKVITIFCAIIFYTACVTTTEISKQTDPENEHPQWLTIPPAEENYFFGIGSDPDITIAKEKSIINAGQQFSVNVSSVLINKTEITQNKHEDSFISISNHVTDLVVKGTKFIDQYQDSKGNYWILSKAPLDCSLDMTESLLLSYRLDIDQDELEIESILKNVEFNIEKSKQHYLDENYSLQMSTEVIITGNAIALLPALGQYTVSKGTHKKDIILYFENAISRNEIVTKTNEQGQFSFKVPVPGTYKLKLIQMIFKQDGGTLTVDRPGPSDMIKIYPSYLIDIGTYEWTVHEDETWNINWDKGTYEIPEFM